jgi:histidyl-tRNA synthetase
MSEPLTIPKGTRDFTPEQVLKRDYIFNTLKTIFVKYGFVPIETPSMEQLTTLLGKYGAEGDKLLFKILNSGDFLSDVKDEELNRNHTNALSLKVCEKGLRYDLTVPFARYVVMHRNELTFPFKRYQIQPVWRADRPQKGRYREFFQCDVDVIGSQSLMNEVELLLIINDVFNALNLKVQIVLNNRKILQGLAEKFNVTDNFFAFTSALDKLDKIGVDKVLEELKTLALSDSHLHELKSFILRTQETKSSMEKLSITETFLQNEVAAKGISEMRYLLEKTPLLNLDCEVTYDFLLARGLNYYTGTILEVKSFEVPMGSLCGGGRYDNLTGIFGMPDVSGVGMSFGADRIYDVIETLNRFPENLVQPTSLLVANFIPEFENEVLQLALKIRSKNINLELFSDSGVKLKKQLNIANQKKIPWVLLCGEDEIKQGKYTLKNMINGEQFLFTFDELITYLNNYAKN